jgi:hypothetical protein
MQSSVADTTSMEIGSKATKSKNVTANKNDANNILQKLDILAEKEEDEIVPVKI